MLCRLTPETINCKSYLVTRSLLYNYRHFNMIELKAFVSVFILTLLSAQNGQASTLGSNGTLRSPQRRSSDGKQIAPYLVWITKEVPLKEIPTTESSSFFRNIFSGNDDLMVYKSVNIKSCRGAIISTRFILTTADCAVEYEQWECGEDVCSSYEPVYARDFKVDLKTRYGTELNVKEVYIPPNVKTTDKENQCHFHSDVVLLELENPLRFKDTVNKVKLPEPVYLSKLDLDESKTNRLANENEFCTIVTTADSVESRIKGTKHFKLEKIQLIDTNKCIDFLNTSTDTYKNKRLCMDTPLCSNDKEAFSKVSSVDCHDRNGNPLVCGEELIGLVSWSVGKCFPLELYTRVDVHVPWIQSVMKNTTQT